MAGVNDLLPGPRCILFLSMINEALTSPLSPLGLERGAVRNADIFRGLPIPMIDNARDIKYKSKGSSTFKNTFETNYLNYFLIQDVSPSSEYEVVNWSTVALVLKLTCCKTGESIREWWLEFLLDQNKPTN